MKYEDMNFEDPDFCPRCEEGKPEIIIFRSVKRLNVTYKEKVCKECAEKYRGKKKKEMGKTDN